MAPPLLEVENISVGYGAVPALRDLSLHVNQGEMVALLGAKGAGKTATLRTVAGMLAPTSGTIRMAGHLVQGRSADEMARAGVAYVAEGRQLLDRSMTSDPRLLLVDELSLGLERREVERLLGLLRDVNAAGTAVVFVERLAQRALPNSDRVYVLRNGEVAVQGRSSELLAAESPLASSLGEAASAGTS